MASRPTHHKVQGPLLPELRCPGCRKPLTRLGPNIVCLSLAGCDYSRPRLAELPKQDAPPVVPGRARADRILAAVRRHPGSGSVPLSAYCGERPETVRSVLVKHRGRRVIGKKTEDGHWRWWPKET